MKKKNLLVLICLLLVIALVGCGNKDNVATNKDTETVAKETVDEAVTEEETEETEETEATEEDVEEEATEEEATEEETTEEATEESEKAEETEQKAKEEANKNTTKSNTKKTEKSTTEQTAKKTANKETEKQKDTTPTPTPKPDPTPTPKPEPTPTPEPKEEEPEQKEVEKKGLLALTPQELKRMLDEEYPGDSMPVWWTDTHSGEKLYVYMWKTYSKEGMMDFYRTAERVIDENTIECDITRTMKDEAIYLHKIRLKVDDEGIWTVVSDKIVG